MAALGEWVVGDCLYSMCGDCVGGRAEYTLKRLKGNVVVVGGQHVHKVTTQRSAKCIAVEGRLNIWKAGRQ